MEELLVYDYEKKELVKEKIYKRNLLTFLYNTYTGKLLTELIFKRRIFSKIYGYFKRNYKSRDSIHQFINLYRINCHEINLPISKFNDLNDFFKRSLKSSSRPIAMNPNILISPADSRLLIYPILGTNIKPFIGAGFSIQELVKQNYDISYFVDGLCLIFRLSVIDCHRFIFIDDGQQEPVIKIKGS